MTAYITNPFRNIPKKKDSNARAWAEHWSRCIDAEITNDHDELFFAEVIYLEHGNAFARGKFNLPKITIDVANKLAAIHCSGAQIISLDRSMPKYTEHFETLIGGAGHSSQFDQAFVDTLANTLHPNRVIPMTQLTYRDRIQKIHNSASIVVGDEYCAAYAPLSGNNRPVAVQRFTGVSLHQFLNRHLISVAFPPNNIYDTVTLSFGYHDIRNAEHRDSFLSSLHSYAEKAHWFANHFNAQVEVCIPQCNSGDEHCFDTTVLMYEEMKNLRDVFGYNFKVVVMLARDHIDKQGNIKPTAYRAVNPEIWEVA